jgi:hypothetical protein
VPTKITKAKVIGKTASEMKIGNILRNISYVFEENVKINGTEIDFLFPSDIILEFNGMFHYKINGEAKQYQLTKYY